MQGNLHLAFELTPQTAELTAGLMTEDAKSISTRPIQAFIFLGSANRITALIGWGKGGYVTAAGWQVTLCDIL